MYESPISIYETAMNTIMEQRENAIFAKIQDAFDVHVDKKELIRALQYDRDQYNRGYADGKWDSVVHGEWLQTKEPLGWRDVDCIECSACHESWIVDEDWCFEDYPWKYCPNCGAKNVLERK